MPRPWLSRPGAGKDSQPPNPFLVAPPQPDPAPPSVPVEQAEEPSPASVPVLPPRPAGRPSAGAKGRMLRVSMSVTPEEHEAWTLRSKMAGYKQLARWAREAVSAHVEATSTSEDDALPRDELTALRVELRRVGTNLNQIARALNAEAQGGGSVDRGEVLSAIESTHHQLGVLRAWTAERS